MQARSSLAIAALLALLAGAPGCRREPTGCFVTGVSVAQGLPAPRMEELGLDRDQVRRAGIEALAATPGFTTGPAQPARGARRCRADLTILDARLAPGKEGPVAEVLLSLDVTPGDATDGHREVSRSADALRPGEPPAAAFLRAVRKAASRASAGVALALAEADKPDAEVIRDLDSADARLRDLAVRVLAERRNPAAVPPLLERLRDPDPDVAERAVGALAQVGDPRAVGPLIELTRRREGPFVTQIVRIIGDIGGPEAEAYLETLAAGHPDPEVTRAARESLRDLRRRPPPSAAPAAGTKR